MRLFVKLMALVVIAALAAPFILKGADGQPLMRWQDVRNKLSAITRGMLSDGRDQANSAARAAGFGNAGKVVVYRWRDAAGQWHYADEENAPDGSEPVYLDPDTNTWENARPAPASSAREATDLPLLPGARAQHAADQARKAREQLSEREADMQHRSQDD